jgi:uncharacterized protein (DUF58 family)
LHDLEMPAVSEELFPAEFLARLEALSFLARKLVRGRQRAERRSTQRGASIEFAEYRPFVSGDDFRHIDWNAFARWRQLVLKLYVEEEDLHVHFLLDGTGSMDFGTPRKFDYARRALAGLSYLALSKLDRVAVAPLGGAQERWPAARGKHRFLQLLDYLRACPVAAGSVSLEDAVRRWSATRPRRGMAVLVSDLFGAGLEDAFAALDRLRHAKHEIVVVQVVDPRELEAGDNGEFDLVDHESGARRKVVVDGQARAEYRKAVEAYHNRLTGYCRRHGLRYLRAPVHLPVEDLLLRSLTGTGVLR